MMSVLQKYCIGTMLIVISTTATVAEDPITLIGFGSCAKQSQPQPLLDVVAQKSPDLFIYLGDNIYGDTKDMDRLRARYAELGARPEYTRMKASTRILATWDDHDFGADDAGREYPKKEESKEIFMDFFDEPMDSPRRDHSGIYTAYEFGSEETRVQVILLDLRTFRSRLKRAKIKSDIPHAGPYVPNKSKRAVLMGEEQWAWLEEQLKRPAKIRIIASSIQFAAELHGWESWANFPRERERFIQLVDDTDARGVILLSGDMHYGELSVLTENVPYPLYDITSSGINRVWEHPMENIRRLSKTEYREHIGWIEIDWKISDTTVTLSLETQEGPSFVTHTIPLSELSK